MAARAALITGGSSGIGLALARLLGEEGHSLTVSARQPEKLENAARELADQGLDVHAVPANMLQEDDVVALAAAHRER
jgi:NAD(P)-dependent dehydrogenase (short-subunit alcohol dehydrogenase family)